MNDCHRYQDTLRRLASDPEISLPDNLALHLDDCVHCRRLFDASRIPLDPASFEVLSPAARKRILQALAAVRSPSRRGLPALAAALVLAGLLAVFLVPDFKPGGQGRPIAAYIVQDHIRYLTHPDRRHDTDMGPLKDYVSAYVDFPFELSEVPGARLTGMRRCLLVDLRAALIFYDMPTGPASYFIIPGDGLQIPGSKCPGDEHLFCAALHGYRIVSWEEAGLLHVVVGADEVALMAMARTCTEMTGIFSHGGGSS